MYFSFPFSQHCYYSKDVVLLLSPRDNVAPKQSVKLNLHKKKHIIQGFQIHKEWSDTELKTRLCQLFEDKLGDVGYVAALYDYAGYYKLY